MNYKEIDKQVIVKYMTGKDAVNVKDIIEECGTEKLCVYPILFEMEQDKELEVIEREYFGAAKVVRLLV